MIVTASQTITIHCVDPPTRADEPPLRGTWIDAEMGIVTHEGEGKTLSGMVAESIAARVAKSASR